MKTDFSADELGNVADWWLGQICEVCTTDIKKMLYAEAREVCVDAMGADPHLCGELVAHMLADGECPSCTRDERSFETGQSCETCGYCPHPTESQRRRECAEHEADNRN